MQETLQAGDWQTYTITGKTDGTIRRSDELALQGWTIKSSRALGEGNLQIVMIKSGFILKENDHA